MIATSIGVLLLIASGALLLFRLRDAYYQNLGHVPISFTAAILTRIRTISIELAIAILFAAGLCLVVVQSVSVEAVFEICMFIFIVRAVSKPTAKK